MTEEEAQNNLGDDICTWCPLHEHQKGVRCYGGQVYMCEGSRCDDAMEAFYENQIDELNESMDELVEKALPLILKVIRRNNGTEKIYNEA